ncbi:MAG: hypothetical protein HYY63_02280 [Elusimicrobia bacterium]|nr:hypothetical protein [Elusimicrobiota bacterium]
MEKHRLDKERLWSIIEAWDTYVPTRIHLVACGGTALTIQDIKASTKDIDFTVPIEKEYSMLISTIQKLGYTLTTGYGWARKEKDFIFDLFPGNNVYITELLESPLKKGNHIEIKSFKKIIVSALNDYDLIITKMFRGTSVDLNDCLALSRSRGKVFDVEKLKKRYAETAQYDVNPARMLQNLQWFLDSLRRK